jgi:hypothetical protein
MYGDDNNNENGEEGKHEETIEKKSHLLVQHYSE